MRRDRGDKSFLRGWRPTQYLLACPHLIAKDGVVAEHPNDHRTFRQCIYLVGGQGLIGGAVLHRWRACRLRLRTVHRAGAEPEHRDQRADDWQSPKSVPHLVPPQPPPQRLIVKATGPGRETGAEGVLALSLLAAAESRGRPDIAIKWRSSRARPRTPRAKWLTGCRGLECNRRSGIVYPQRGSCRSGSISPHHRRDPTRPRSQ